MEIAIDPQRRRFLTRKVRSGQFKSASEVVKFAIDRLRQDERDLAHLKRKIQKEVDSLESGEGTPWDVNEAKTRLLRRFAGTRKRGNA